MTFKHHETLDYSKEDASGFTPNKALIGKVFNHTKTGRDYIVSGFVWDSDTDCWKVFYSRRGCVVSFTRSPLEFTAPRFVEVVP